MIKLKNCLCLKAALIVSIVFLTGCQGTYYATMEALGQHKRDILMERIAKTSQCQGKAQKQFQSLLENISDIKDFQDGNIVSKYNTLNSEYRKSLVKARDVDKRIKEVEEVAKLFFREWEDELEVYGNEKLRRSSEQQLDRRRTRCLEVIHAMKSAEAKIDPALLKMGDYVLFLKHNINAHTIASLDEELGVVKDNIALVVETMGSSIAEANKFVDEMDDASQGKEVLQEQVAEKTENKEIVDK